MANPLQDAIASSGYDPIADAEANPNGAITAANNPGAFNSQGDMIRAPAVTAVTPASVTRDDRGNVIATTPAQAQYAPAAGLHSSAPAPPAPPVAPAGPASPVVPYAPPATPAAPAPARNPLQAQAAGGPAFDPFANQKIAAQGEEGALLNRKLGVAAGGGMRDEALGAAGAENARYAKEVDNAAQIQRMQASKLDADHAKLIDNESKRDYTKEYWASKSVGSKIASFLSATAGGFLQGYRGLASNPALDAINRDVDRHVQAARENSHLKIDASKSLYDHFREKVKDAETSRALTHAATMDSLGADLEKARAGTKDQEEIGHIDDQLQSVRMQTAQWKDAAKAAAVRANAPKTTEQLLAEQKSLSEIKHIEAETGKTGAETNKLQAEAAAAASAPGGSVPTPESTAYDPTRLFQGTDAFASKQGQDRWNSQVLAKLHKANPVRSPDVLNAMAAAYKVEPGDTKSTVDRKVAAFQADYQKRSGNPLQAQAAGADDEPETFAAP